jgi:hypothetical protein
MYSIMYYSPTVYYITPIVRILLVVGLLARASAWHLEPPPAPLCAFASRAPLRIYGTVYVSRNA